MSTAELRFTRRIRSVFDKLIPNKNKKFKKNNADTTNFSSPAKKIILKSIKVGKVGWKEGIIEKLIERLVYIIKHPKWLVKRHDNQLKKRYTSEQNYRREEPIKVTFDLFELPRPQVASKQKRPSRRKRQPSLTFLKKWNVKRRRCCGVIKNTTHWHNEIVWKDICTYFIQYIKI